MKFGTGRIQVPEEVLELLELEDEEVELDEEETDITVEDFFSDWVLKKFCRKGIFKTGERKKYHSLE